jgi:lipoprotein-releasing system permease protein
MLVLEKQKDIGILKAMGADALTIRMIFLAEGVLWALAGGIVGILLGTGLCLLQQKYGFIKMGSSFVIDAYPVELQVPDILLDLLTILAVGLLAAWYPSARATRATDLSLKST